MQVSYANGFTVLKECSGFCEENRFEGGQGEANSPVRKLWPWSRQEMIIK